MSLRRYRGSPRFTGIKFIGSKSDGGPGRIIVGDGYCNRAVVNRYRSASLGRNLLTFAYRSYHSR